MPNWGKINFDDAFELVKREISSLLHISED